MTTDQAILQRDTTEASFVAELKARSATELRSFMSGPWTASILSSEAIEELYHILQQKEAFSIDGALDNSIEMALD